MWKPIITVCALFCAGPAAAQTVTENGGLFSFVALTSDYRWAGASSSGRQPVPQLSVHWWRPDDSYAGLFVTGVDYNDPGQTSVEVDLYAGHNFDVGEKTRLTAEVMYTLFPDRQGGGPTYDFVQVKAKAQRTEGPLTASAAILYTPMASYHAGPATRAELEAAWAVSTTFKVSGKTGRNWVTRGHDRAFWNIGATATWRDLAFDLRYHDTDIERRQDCLWSDACKPAIVGTLTVNLQPIMLPGKPWRGPIKP